ncbi:MAG: hypothetical protein IPK82_36235 [Polyangiaceae bacterium]|nr:hypothetical protein [Polyangiaceae bacterium]
MSASHSSSARPSLITKQDVEAEVERLFGTDGLVVRVLSDDPSQSARDAAFGELLESLRMYGYTDAVTVEAPNTDAIWKGLAVLSKEHLQRQLFQRILMTFGGKVVNPLVSILDSTPEGVRARMNDLRTSLLGSVGQLKISFETASLLREDLGKLLTDDYLNMLAEHEEQVQRPLAEKLAHEVLHVIGATFQRAFKRWPDNARTIADSVSRRMGSRMSLRTSPKVIRDRIVEGIENFLWVETSNELDGALQQMLSRHQWNKLVDRPAPEIDREVYREFAEACWDLVSNNA